MYDCCHDNTSIFLSSGHDIMCLSVCLSVCVCVQVSLKDAVFRLVPRKEKPSNGHGGLL